MWGGGMSVKRLIAREGLVILGVLFLGGLFLLSSLIYPPLPNVRNLYEGLSPFEKKSVEDFVKFRQLFPEYDDLDNLTLAQKLASKFPEYQDMFKGVKEISKRSADKYGVL